MVSLHARSVSLSIVLLAAFAGGGVARAMQQTAAPAATTRPCRLIGRITSGDTPLPGAVVTILRDDKPLGATSTDAGGEYALALIPGSYRLRVELTAFARHERDVTLGVPPCEQQVDAARGVIAENFPRGTKVTRPTGGFILWVELPRGGDSIALFEKLLERGISIAPGPMFSATQRYRNCLRVSVGHPWTERTEKALAEVGRLARAQLGEGAVANA